MNRYLHRLPHALLAAMTLAAAGCGQQAHASPPQTQTDGAVQLVGATAEAPPPINTVTLPPAPTPATFDVAALAEKVRPLVVNITTTHRAEAGPEGGLDPFEFFFGPNGPRGSGPREAPRGSKRQALGTGFIIDASGYVVTNAHVVDGADEVKVRLADERELTAEVVGRDPKLDVALLRIRGAKDLPAAPLGSSDQLRVGEHVLAVGNPFGLGHTVTLGIVSAKARSIGAGPYDDFIQTDASINPGNSGGPLFNWRGEVIGINTAIRAGANGIGFAIPVDAVKDVLPQLRTTGHVARGRLGLAFQPMTAELANAMGLDGSKGALVADVEPGGAAARAGIKAGDVVMAVNGTAILHAEELPRRIARNAPGSTVKLLIVRDKQQREVSATLDVLPDDEAADASRSSRGRAPPGALPADKLGIQVSDAPGGGVRVDDVRDDGSAGDLARGDVIVDVNGAPVKDVQGLRAATAKLKPGSTALLKVRRGRLMRFSAVAIPMK